MLSQLSRIKAIQATELAFAGIRCDGSVVCWGTGGGGRGGGLGAHAEVHKRRGVRDKQAGLEVGVTGIKRWGTEGICMWEPLTASAGTY